VELIERIKTISGPEKRAMQAARDHWNGIAKPIGSLGLLEEDIIRIAGLTGDPRVRLGKRGVLVFCADNGVVNEGVTQTGQEVTALVAGNMTRRDSSVCRMAEIARAEVFPVDMGMASPVEGVRDLHIRRGTGNIARGPAMSRGEAEKAVQVGIDLVGELKNRGYGIIATGEMGIGNTTTASALAAVFLGLEPAAVTGRGAGLTDAPPRLPALCLGAWQPCATGRTLHSAWHESARRICDRFFAPAAALGTQRIGMLHPCSTGDHRASWPAPCRPCR